jgi:protoporphyrinogen oxidase
VSTARSARAPVAVLGAGPAGLAAALRLARAGREVVLVDREDGVGGLARTVERDGYRFDIGGHRFFTRIPEVRALWQELVGGDMLVRPRRSRILFDGKYFDYPLTAGSALAGLGPLESLRVAASYARARLRPIRPEASLADWVTNRFGRRLFETFFRTYTEKLWGIACEQISAAWAAQRIRGLSLRAALADMVRRGSGGQRTLVTEFEYPRLGPGMLWERMRSEIEALGGRTLLSHRLAGLRHDAAGVRAVELTGPSGAVTLGVSHVVSTVPMRDLATALSPALPSAVAAAAGALWHRAFIQVALVLEGDDPFPDTWLYLHDPGVRAGRVQNFRAWSPALVPEPMRACIGVEYFCSAGDALWSRGDDELARIAEEDLAAIGFAGRRVVAAHVVRMRDAYPVYNDGFAGRIALVARELGRFGNLAVAGRNGMHRYNNMDHAMRSGLLAAENALGAAHDLWSADLDDGYLEPEPVARAAA